MGLKSIMIEKVMSVSCIVAKFLSFINHCLNVFQKLEVMVQNQNRRDKFSNSTSQSLFLDLKALGLKSIMIEKVMSVSCIVAKFLSFINHCLNVFQKLEVMVQKPN